MKLCQKYSIHLISDEVYGLSIYDVPHDPSEPNSKEPISFKSVLAIDWQQYIDPTYLHVLYGFSKDLASGGMRLGCMWSRNAALMRAVGGLSLFNWTSNVSEAIGITMLEDEAWMESFLKTSQRRLGERAALARSVLDDYNIPYAKGACAGFFLWVDLRSFLVNEKGDKVTWGDERALVKKMKEKRVYLTNGEALSSEEPGFFRFCFVKNELEVREGLKRLVEALGPRSQQDIKTGWSSNMVIRGA
jgi:aspartate/methionine/tyrosine aminotransferase